MLYNSYPDGKLAFPELERLELLGQYRIGFKSGILETLQARISSPSVRPIKYLRIPRSWVGADKGFQEQLESLVFSLVLTEGTHATLFSPNYVAKEPLILYRLYRLNKERAAELEYRPKSDSDSLAKSRYCGLLTRVFQL